MKYANRAQLNESAECTSNSGRGGGDGGGLERHVNSTLVCWQVQTFVCVHLENMMRTQALILCYERTNQFMANTEKNMFVRGTAKELLLTAP